MKYIKVILFILVLSWAMSVVAQDKEKTVEYWGWVEDFVTHTAINDAKVSLMDADGNLVKVETSNSRLNQNDGGFVFRVTNNRKYTIKVEHDSYVPQSISFDVKASKRVNTRYLPTIFLRKKKKLDDEFQLNEVTVTATKVKFYHKGDTLVYNADAFQLSEGSMLDALIKQLPGAELKSDGSIYVNGRFVESLLLNGKDFFKGNNTVLLQNLPTYAVNSIKVYEKKTDLNLFAKRKVEEDEYVMDVNLKKQYNIGWLGNVDAGMANDNMYMGRLFALRSTDHSQLAIFGNMNNMNDYTTPMQGTDWTPDKLPMSRLTTKKVGVNLNVDDRFNRFRLRSNADLTHYDNHEETNAYRTNFLSSGDTYERSMNEAKYCNFYLNMNNMLTLTPGGRESKCYMTIDQKANYSRRKQNSIFYSALMAESWENQEQMWNRLFPISTGELYKSLINRVESKSLNDLKSWLASLDYSCDFIVNEAGDMLQLKFGGDVFGKDDEGYSIYSLDYASGNVAGNNDYRRRYAPWASKGYRYHGGLGYSFNFSDKLWGAVQYGYEQKYSHEENSLYRLDQLAGWGTEAKHELGVLPSVTDYLSTIDVANSYQYEIHADAHKPFAVFSWQVVEDAKNDILFKSQWNFNFSHENMRYRRASLDKELSRNFSFLTPELTLYWSGNRKNRKFSSSLVYSITQIAPQMIYLFDYIDDADPLNVKRYGNEKLKNSMLHHLQFAYNGSFKSLMYDLKYDYASTSDAVAMGFIYDRNTGKRTFSPTNVTGNWNTNLRLGFSGNVDKKKRLMFNTVTSWGYVNSVDMISDTATEEMKKSIVKTSTISEDLRLDYKLGKHSFGVNGYVACLHSCGVQKNFETLHAYNYHYGLNAVLALPFRFSFDTDLSMYSRRGYDETAMNDDNLLWNFRLSRPFFKGSLVVKADAFDVFQQLKKTDRTINAQGRVEKYYNTVPRYVLIHAIFRFHVAKGKK